MSGYPDPLAGYFAFCEVNVRDFSHELDEGSSAISLQWDHMFRQIVEAT